MKNHHLFLLIVSLLLAASFIFPTMVSQSITPPPVPTKPSTYFVHESDDVPANVLAGDYLKIATQMNNLWGVKNATVSNIKLLTYDAATGSMKNILEGQYFPTETILTEHNNVPGEYIVIQMPKVPGKYQLTYTLTPSYGNFSKTNPNIMQSHVSHDIEVFPLTPGNVETIVKNGDNGR